MGFTPKSREEVDAMNVLDPGTYDFEVTESEEQTSKKGNQMIAINMKVFREDGSYVFVRDWLVDAENYMSQHKNRSFCDSCGIDELSEYIAGSCGLVVLQVEETDEYGKQNRVIGYTTQRPEKKTPRQTVPQGPTQSQRQHAMEQIDDGEIPF
jgi:hypothetical protein